MAARKQAMQRRPSEGPWVSVAAICQRVLDEKDNVLSLIRLVDQLTIATVAITKDGRRIVVDPDALPAELQQQVQHTPSPPQQFALVIVLKGGQLGTTARLRIEAQAPNGQRTRVADEEITFTGSTGGHNVIIDVYTRFEMPGLYWFNVSYDGRLLTRVPYDVTLARPAAAQAPEDQSASSTERA